MNRVTCFLLGSCFLIGFTACGRPAARYKIAVVPSGTGQHGIFVMNSDTTGGRLLVTDVMAQLRLNSWSPDGSRIAFFSSRREDLGLLEKYQIPQHSPLYVMDASGANQKRVLDYPVSAFGWSPDGRKLFVISAYEDPARNDPAVISGKRPALSAIYTLDLQSGGQKRLTSWGQNCTAAWSPDGTRLALSLGEGDNTDLYVTSLDAAHVRRLTESQTTDMRPAWSPDGKRIAYISMAGPGSDPNDSGVFVIEPEGGGKRRVAGMPAYGVSWSPDGNSLLLQAIGGIYLAGIEGGDVKKIRVPTDRLLDAVFTPDGKDAMFRSNYEGNWNLYTVELSSGKARRLTEQLSAFMFCVSPLL